MLCQYCQVCHQSAAWSERDNPKEQRQKSKSVLPCCQPGDQHTLAGLTPQRVQHKEPHRELASFVLDNLLLEDVHSCFELFEGEKVHFVGLLGMASHGFINASHYFLVQLPAQMHNQCVAQAVSLLSTPRVSHVALNLHCSSHQMLSCLSCFHG